jgi:signal transduction histidine kinase
LINNVLQLARLSRNEQAASISAVTVGAALAELEPRLLTQLEPSGFSLNIGGDAAVLVVPIHIDVDWFIQIFINLVDNAVKFSANAAHRSVDIEYRQLQDGRVQFAVRDHGPGIEADQMKKIFTLFYRSENELTRETVGTGIGLALVQQLASAMRAEVDVVNSDPGAEFRVRFPTTG